MPIGKLFINTGGGGAPPLLKVIGTCRWTGYDFAGHQYWHRVSNRPNVVITIDTGYQNRPSWLWRTTSFITGYRMPIVFYDRPAIQAEAMTFFFFFLLVSSASPIRQGISEEYNIATPAPPPPPLWGRRDRMRVPKISGKGVLFVRQSPAREL